MDQIDLFPANRASAPLAVPDQRPTADAAAIARDTRPPAPLAVAPLPGSGAPAKSLSQTGEITRSLLGTAVSAATDPTLPLDKRVDPSQRTLKPYGVSMLPDSRQAEKARSAEAAAQTAESLAISARAEADEIRATTDAMTAEAARADDTATGPDTGSHPGGASETIVAPPPGRPQTDPVPAQARSLPPQEQAGARPPGEAA